MNQEKQPEALRLADELEYISNNSEENWQTFDATAAELSRLHAQNTEQRAELVAENLQLAMESLANRDRIADLEAQLSAIGAGGVESLRKRDALSAGDKCYSNNHGDTWLDCPDDSNFVDGLQVGDEYELQVSVPYWPERFRVTKAPDDSSDDYEVEPAAGRAAQPSRECLQQSAEEVDFLLEDLPPVEGLDVILAEYEKTYGRTPDAAMAATVGKVKNMLLMWWGSHREAIAAALQAAPQATNGQKP